MTLARQGGFTGPIINSYTCQAIQQFMVPAGEAAANVHTLVVSSRTRPTRPTPTTTASSSTSPTSASTAPASTRTSATWPPATTRRSLIVDALTRAAAMEGGLTRANLMNAFWSLDLEPPLALGGVAKVDGVTDAYIAEYGVMAEFDPAARATRRREGVEIDVEGQGGVFDG